MDDDPGIFIGKGDRPVYLLPRLANRHGLIAGATGTGKTVSLQILAEDFSRRGVPVFLSDVKKGHRLRATVSEMGPLLLARMLGLNDTQEGVLYATFRIADDEGMLLLDLKDLRALLIFVGENAKELRLEYGNLSAASIGAIQRRLLVLESEGARQFMGEPALDLFDFMRMGSNGCGNINILAADKLMQTPKLYATFLLWLLSELFEELPEIGDPDKPRLVFFFDEAHLLFKGAPAALIEKIEQVVRLIRSKGVGIYFVTQNPLDIPDTILGQLGNRIQHALRAYTPREQKAVRAAAETFRANPAFDAAEAIKELGVGEALVSTLGGKGIPGRVERTLIRPPASRLGPATRAERQAVMEESPFSRRYDQQVDRRSAYEMLKERADKAVQQPAGRKKTSGRSSNRQGVFEAMVKSIVRSLGTSLGREISRGVLGSILKGL